MFADVTVVHRQLNVNCQGLTPIFYRPTIDFLNGLFVVGRPFVGPPEIPKDRITILRKAFEQAIADPDSIRLTKKANKPLNFVTPATAEKWVDGIFNLPDDTVKILKKAFGVK